METLPEIQHAGPRHDSVIVWGGVCVQQIRNKNSNRVEIRQPES